MLIQVNQYFNHVLPHVFAFMCLFAFLFFLEDKCFLFMNNLGLLEITKWEPWM